MRIIFAGTPQTAVASLEQLNQDHEVGAVLTRAPAPTGRKRVLTKSPVHQRAEELGLPVLTPTTLRDTAVRAEIATLNADAVAVVAYGIIVPADLLDVPTHGWINLHFSELPAWRGAAPVQYAIAAGDDHLATSVFRIEEGLDTGPVYSTRRYARDPEATAGETLERLAGLGARQLSETLNEIDAGTITPVPQSGQPTFAPRLVAADARVDFSRSAEEIKNLILGTTPEPGPWTSLSGDRIKLAPVHVLETSDLAPGELAGGKTARVGTGTRDLELGRVAPAGKTWMNAADWLRGVKINNPRFDEVTNEG